MPGMGGWTTLVDGTQGPDNFNRVGEANIFDQRPDPSYGTGAIVKVAKAPDPMPKAGGKWNTYEITAQGDHLVLMLNGVKTVDVRDAKLASGPIALQWGRGVVKFRKVQIKALCAMRRPGGEQAGLG